ncbi:MAG: glycerol kinase, partial [Ruminococcus sp.]|nr:glycerol kinase [Ruminococcus sp.]
IVPAFAGLGAPHWNMRARGTITGLTRGAGVEHIIRAALESIAYQSEDVISAMRGDMGSEIAALRVDGGASANNLLMQFQADISNLEVIRPVQKEATAAGAAMLAGKAVGFYNDIYSSNALNTIFKPQMTESEREKRLSGWQKAVKACISSEE